MADYSRTQRVADQIQRELASLIQLEMKDPRLGMVTVSAVDLSRDMSYADVFVTVLEQEDKAEREQTLAILTKGAGFLRSRLAHLIKLRIIPTLRFHYDESISRGQHLSALIDKAVSEDRQRSDREAEDN
ncbi:MAG: 30S ribosome-binding factor RbfA [Pseudomonadales bacterium]|nr:30S ribosome-binding factor RbfA [Pseudomonadales bacterium]